MKYLSLSILILFLACTVNNKEYLGEIDTWRIQRVNNLTAPLSWSSLCGLYWLKPGENILGASREANIKFPKEAESVLGNIKYEGDSIIFTANENVVVADEKGERSRIRMYTDAEDSTNRLNTASYFFTAINRNDKVGIRVWDTLHDGRTLYKTLDYFPIDPLMKVKADFITYKEPKKSTLKNVLGMDVELDVAGYLEFVLDGKTHKIEPLDGGPDEFFLIFADETTGGETYGGGRYLYCPKPDEEGSTFIDFNKSYTPPCGFTSFATCLLPSKSNTFSIAIHAGEKYDDSFH